MSSYAAARYRQDKERINRKNTEWYRQNKGKRMATITRSRRSEEWRMKNRVYYANRRARIRDAADGTVTYEAITRLLEAQGWRCKACSADLRVAAKHLDHVKPLCKGGPHSIRNLQWLCKKCNLEKAAKDVV